ncbi:MAG TPA: hypothetical protein VHC49_25715, partial [Mycobacteriales bacterium]|nr:hypothetical protein [Mycobacteriales bacterium]
AGRPDPVLLRIEDEIVALDAAGTLLVDRSGRRRAVHGDRARFAAGEGPYRLDDHEGGVVALCG